MFFIKDLTKLDVSDVVDATFDIKKELPKLGVDSKDKRFKRIEKKLDVINAIVLEHQNNLSFLLEKQGY